MKYSDWRRIAWTTLALGFAFLFASIFTGLYSETIEFYEYAIMEIYPYQGYSLPLTILQVSCFITSVFSFKFADKKRKSSEITIKT